MTSSSCNILQQQQQPQEVPSTVKEKLAGLYSKSSIILDMEDNNKPSPKYDNYYEKNDHEEILKTARKAFESGKTRPINFRRAQLKSLERFLNVHEDDIVQALYKDLRKPRQEVFMGELDLIKNDLRQTIFELGNWTKPKRPEKRWTNLLDDVCVYNDPYGLVLIIGAWNYPFMLVLGPLIGAIAGGNCAIIKPSDMAFASLDLLLKHLPNYLDPNCYHIIPGGIDQTTQLLQSQFDYIFFTGSSRIGKLVHQAAAKFLTPTTLELGGKSPVFLDESADIERATRRILWGKCLNSGQTCISPDYLLCSREVQAKFLHGARKILAEFYGENADAGKSTPDLSKIFTESHFQRLISLLSGGKVAIGGHYDVRERIMAPAILTDVDLSSPVMEEEIFGPILPIINVNAPDEAVRFINSRPKPLALYIFSTKKSVQGKFLGQTSSGCVTINDTIMHIQTENLPFGGVGGSGMGAYHGRTGFETFTHQKAVLVRGLGLLSEVVVKARYPPYSNLKTKFISFAVKKRWRGFGLKWVIYGVVFGAGLGMGMGAHYLYRKWEEA